MRSARATSCAGSAARRGDSDDSERLAGHLRDPIQHLPDAETLGDRWTATSFTSSSRQPPVGRLSVLMHAPVGFNATGAMGGLLVDAWSDTIPEATRDTAMALRFNNASTRAPQTILLAVSPDPAQSWTTDTLVDVLRQTLILTRLRMQPATTFSRGGLMPFAWLGQRPGNTGISFTL